MRPRYNAIDSVNGTVILTTASGAARRFELEVDVRMIGINVAWRPALSLAFPANT